MRKRKRFSLLRSIRKKKEMTIKHNCEDHSIEIKATADKPYHFTWSGLDNVYVSGIGYRRCTVCDNVSAAYPAAVQLMDVLAEAVATKPTALNGEEIRFLRTHAHKRAVDFAALVGVSIEQVSRWENNRNRPEKATDKLIRLLTAKQGIETIRNLRISKGTDSQYTLSFEKKHWQQVP
jgi:putative zinc finger/helix-turn-helix YgiT family protein